MLYYSSHISVYQYIYWGKYSVSITTIVERSLYNENGSLYKPSNIRCRLGYVRLEPFFEKESRDLYHEKEGSEYSEIIWLIDIERDKISCDNKQEEIQRFENNIKEYISVSSSLKMIFGIKHYEKIFYWTFFILLIITTLLVNFKLSLKVKNE